MKYFLNEIKEGSVKLVDQNFKNRRRINEQVKMIMGKPMVYRIRTSVSLKDLTKFRIKFY